MATTRQVRASRRRQRRMRAADNDLTTAEWAAIRTAWRLRCAYCDLEPAGPLQKDCVQPLSRGGRYTVDNVVPACGSCNASKSNSEVTGWLRRTRRDERAFLVRHVLAMRTLRAAADTPEGRDGRPDGAGHGPLDVLDQPQST